MTPSLEQIISHFEIDITQFPSICINAKYSNLDLISTHKKLKTQLKSTQGVILTKKVHSFETYEHFGTIISLESIGIELNDTYKEFKRFDLDFLGELMLKGYAPLKLKELYKTSILAKPKLKQQGNKRFNPYKFIPTCLFIPNNKK